MQKITPYLWFDKNAEEAVNFYMATFGDGKILSTTKYPDAGKEVHGMDAGTTLTVEFEIRGYRFGALNGGPAFKFTPAISFTVNCENADEVNSLWEKLSEDGEALMPLDTYPFNERYGWIKDKYGLTWQLIVRKSEEKIFPSLMYTGENVGKAEEAINFYTSVFKNSKIGDLNRYGPGQAPDKEGTLTYGEFFLEGQKFSAMDSAHEHKFTFTEAVSLLVNCDNQEEINYYWEKLSADPKAEQCGWLKDKYGVSWQIAPGGMDEFLNNPDVEKRKKGMEALLKMKKIDISELERAINS